MPTVTITFYRPGWTWNCEGLRRRKREEGNCTTQQSSEIRQLRNSSILRSKTDWLQLKNTHCESTDAVLGETRRIMSNWISAQTYSRMGERRQIKEKLGRVRSERLKELKREEYKRKDKEVKASAQADKRRMIDRIEEEAQSTARSNNFRDLYRLMKQIVQANTNTVTAVRDKCGKLLMNEEEILQR